MKNKKQKENKMKIELTKKEKNFLLDWLSDDLDLAIENKDTSSNYLINKLKSIIKKIRKETK
jgi:hypothetical protein